MNDWVAPTSLRCRGCEAARGPARCSVSSKGSRSTEAFPGASRRFATQTSSGPPGNCASGEYHQPRIHGDRRGSRWREPPISLYAQTTSLHPSALLTHCARTGRSPHSEVSATSRSLGLPFNAARRQEVKLLCSSLLSVLMLAAANAADKQTYQLAENVEKDAQVR